MYTRSDKIPLRRIQDWSGGPDLIQGRDCATLASGARTKIPLALRLVLFTLFLPEGFSFFVFGLRLTVTRLLFLILAPVLFARFGSKIGSDTYRFVASDLLVPLTGFWMFLGPWAMYGLADSLVHSGPVVMEYLVAYLATRVLLTEDGQAVAFVGLLCLVLCFVVADASLDTLAGHYVTRDLIEQFGGYHKPWHPADEFRYGLLRAAGPIDHPILFGFTNAVGFLISLHVPIRWRRFCCCMCGLGVMLALSSAPEQCALMGVGLLAYARLVTMRRKWLLLSVPPLLGATILLTSVDRPFGRLFNYITIDPQTAFYRLYIWNMVGPAILASPWFGVVEGSYEYEGSVDSLWLVLSMMYGIPCAILTGLSMIGACWLPTAPPYALLSDDAARLGTVLGVIIFLVIFMAFTVHLWASTWILVGLLVGLRAHLGELGRLRADAQVALSRPAIRRFPAHD